MQSLFEVASTIATPLALSGFFAAAFFLIAKQIIAKNIFPKLTPQLSSHIIILVIDRLFYLSLVAMALGFFGYALTWVRNDSDSNRPQAVTAAQFAEIQKLSEHFIGKTEHELQVDFGFDDMFKRNVDHLISEYRHVNFGEPLGLPTKPGEALLILSEAGAVIDRETGSFTPMEPVDDRILVFLVLPARYLEASSRFSQYGDSIFLTKKTRDILRDYVDHAKENAVILGDVLDSAVREFPERYRDRKTTPKPHRLDAVIWIHNRWQDKFKPLAPRAEELKRNLRQYVMTE